MRTLVVLAFVIATPAQVLVNGAGATFPYPIYSRWFDAFHRLHPNALINYQPVGSGAGIRQLAAGVLDLGATDMPVDDTTQAQLPVSLLHFPTVVGAVVPIYNLPKFPRDLDFTPEMLAGIFLGRISRWDDPSLKESSHGEPLPSKEIAVIHRSDGSGSTYILSDYFCKVSPEWKSAVGKGVALQWRTGIGAKGNEGVAGMTKQTPFSIGYVELAYALQNRLTYGRLRNRAGKFIKADVAAIKAAADAAGDAMPGDFRISITDAPGRNAYPIASYTWLLVPARIANTGKRQIIVDFLHWMVLDGQRMVEDLGYAPLSGPVAGKVLKACDRIQ